MTFCMLMKLSVPLQDYSCRRAARQIITNNTTLLENNSRAEHEDCRGKVHSQTKRLQFALQTQATFNTLKTSNFFNFKMAFNNKQICFRLAEHQSYKGSQSQGVSLFMNSCVFAKCFFFFGLFFLPRLVQQYEIYNPQQSTSGTAAVFDSRVSPW